MDVRWELREHVRTVGGEVAFGIFGEGTPVVLVHGTPSRAYLWRGVVARLAEGHAVYVYDMPGYGESDRYEGQDVSISGQARVLSELVEAWGPQRPAVAGHDIGGGIVLRAHLIEAYVAARLRETTARPMEEGAFEAYLSQWRGTEGRAAYLRKDEALVGRDTAEVEARLGSVRTPVQVVWDQEDAWLDPSQAETLARDIPGAGVRMVEGAGHFVMEDVAEALAGLLAKSGGVSQR